MTLTRDAETEAAFEQLLKDQQDPSSKRYHQWLTPQQVGDLYGPTQHDVDAVTAWLTAQGLTVVDVSASRTAINISGDVSAVSAAFATQLHSFVLDDGSTRYSAVSAPSIPQAFSGVVLGVTGLVEEHLLTSHKISKLDGPVATPFAMSAGLTPTQVQQIYGLTYFQTLGITGTGQKMAVIASSRPDNTTIQSFFTKYGLSSSLPNIIVPSTTTDPGITGDGNESEAELDIERFLATAPGAKVDLVAGANLLTTTVQAMISYANSTLNDPLMNLSIYACENSVQKTSTLAFDSLFQTAEAQGTSVFVASGDAGAAGCEMHNQASDLTPVLSANALCSSTHVTCVGGTSFTTIQSHDSGSWTLDGAWNDPGTTNFVVNATGGGASVYIAKPSWQTGTGVPSDGARDTPDISLLAGGTYGYFACVIGNCNYYVGGTSASSPTMGGIAALWNTQAGKKLGNLNSMLYKAGSAAQRAPYIGDVTLATSGLNACDLGTPSVCNNSTPSRYNLTGGLQGYALATGYDQVTGLGIPNGYQLGQAIYGGTKTAPFIVNPLDPVPANSVTPAVVATFTANTAPLPTGLVSYYLATGTPVTPNKPLSAPTDGSMPTASTTFATTTAGSTINAVIHYSGDSNYAPADVTLPITVHGAAVATVALTATPASPATTTLVALTAKLTSTLSTKPTGRVYFYNTSSSTAVAAVDTPDSSGNYTYSFYPTRTALTWYATYVGDANYTTSQSGTVTVTGTAVATTTAAAFASNNLDYGVATPLTVTVTPAIVTSSTVPGPLPTGSLTVLVDTTTQTFVNPTYSITADGKAFTATVMVTITSSGTHSITTSFVQDTRYNASSGTKFTVTVGNQPTATATLSALSPVAVVGVKDTLYFTLVTNPATAAAPTGMVTFLDGTSTLATATTFTPGAAGTYVASADGIFTTTGAHSITAKYAGSSVYVASTAGPITINVSSGPVLTASLAAAKTTIDPNVSNVITVTVNSTPTTAPTPTGVVTIMDGTTTLGKATALAAGGTAGTYTATYSSVLLTAGAHNLTASIASDSNYASVTSSPVTVTVNNVALAVPTLDKSSLSFTSGASTGNVVNVTYTSYNGLAATVPVACSITGSSSTYPPTCTVSPSSVTLAAGGTATAAVTVNSTALKSSMDKPSRPGSPLRDRLPLLAVTVPVLLYLRRRKVTMQLLMAALLSAGVALSLSGCSGGGGGGSSTTSTPTTPTGSSAGTYTLTITATVNNSPVTTTVAVTIN
jgi:hypothetical protein